MAYLRTRLGRWFYEDSNETSPAASHGGRAIVLLHSLLCDSGMWRGQRAALAAIGRVVVIDGPGHGRSEVPPPFTLEEHASAVVEAFDQLGIDRALVVGLSWGGMLAMRLAISHPSRLLGMALLDTSADGTRLRDRLEYSALCLLTRQVGLPAALVRKKIVPLMFAPRTRVTQPDLVDGFIRTLGGYPREGVTRAATAVAIDRPSILDQLHDIQVPTLVGYGALDTATPPDHSRRIAARIARSRLVPFAGAGHLSALEASEVVNAALVPWVREQFEGAAVAAE